MREVRGRGLLLAAVLDRDAGTVVDACRDAGLLVLTAGTDVLRLPAAARRHRGGGRRGARFARATLGLA